MKQYLYLVVFECLIYGLAAENDVLLTNLEPEEAKQVIDQQDQSLRYAPKIDTNVPAVRYLGRSPYNVLEDIYLAHQYHGQDGLGAYLYGYSVPDIAKNEKKERSGDLKGAYSYINTEGKEVKVKYWDDGTGFHQEDNLDEILPKQVEDSPDVKAAKENFFRIWREEAERNAQGNQEDQPVRVGIGPFGAPSNPPYQAQPSQYQPSSQPAPVYAQSQGSSSFSPSPFGVSGSGPSQGVSQSYGGSASLLRKPPQPASPNPNSIDYTGQYSENRPTYIQPAGQLKKSEEEEEVTGPPKGFFYAFDYPVGIIVNKGEPLESVYSQSKDLFEKQIRGQAAPPPSGVSSYHAGAK